MAKKLSAPEGYFTKEEKQFALDGLNPADVLRVAKVAKRLSGQEFTGDELIQEAKKRIIAGDRNWKKSMRPAPFLIGVMRSIANAGFRKKSAENAVKYSLDQEGAAEPISDEGEHPRPSPEDHMIQAEDDAQKMARAKAVMDEIWDLFKDDPEATQVLQGQLAGRSVVEVCSIAGLNSIQYNTTRRRIRRAIDKKYPNGWRVS